MVREFKFFRGYVDDLSININRINDINRLIVTPGYGTITITPGTSAYTIPYNYNGTINTATGFSLTTSNPNGITYTTSGMGGTLTTGTATYTNSAFTTNTK